MTRFISSKIIPLLFFVFMMGMFTSDAQAQCPPPGTAQQQQNGYQQAGIPPNTPPPNSGLGATSYLQCLTNRETGGYQNVTNAWGYSGMFGYGVNAAATAGICGNSPPLQNCVQNWNTCNFATGRFCNKTVNGVYYTLCDRASFFSNSPQAVQAQIIAQGTLQQNQWQTITNLTPNVNSYLGQTINGVVVTQEVLLGMAHLRGPGYIDEWLRGEATPADGNGATMTGYGTCLSKCMSGDNGPCDPRTGEGCIAP